MSGESQSNWTAVTTSAFPWEKEALDYIRSQFPTHEPYRAWSNFEFTADDGSLNEVDLLVFSKMGFFLVEIKSNPGVLSGDCHSWKWLYDGRTTVTDTPLRLANLKAKKLASLLKRQRAFEKMNVPFIEALVFCSADGLGCELQGNARFHVCLRDKPNRPGIMAALKSRDCPGLAKFPRGDFDRPTAKSVARALDQIGVRPTHRSLRVGDYELKGLIDEGPGYQDFLGKHVTLTDTFRRIRIYPTLVESSTEQRVSIRRAAEREFNLLQALEHPGILRAMDFTTHERGPVIIFQHVPAAVRLDHFLIEHKDTLSTETRLALMRQIAETIDFAHGKHVVHRNLSPRNILVNNPDTASPKTVLMNWQLGYRQTDGDTLLSKEVTATIHMDQFAEEPSKVFMAPETFTDFNSLGQHHDIFSLGAVCYQLFTGQPPAESPLALAEKLRVNRGLLVSSVLNGAPQSLEHLVRESTDPDVETRLDSASEFIENLDKIEEELTTPDNQFRGDPTTAKHGDILPGGYVVERKLGTGSTATAMLVRKDDRTFVLKIAVDTDHNDRVRAEGEVLRQFESPLVVRYHNTIQIEDHAAILLDQAGEKTLRKRLNEEGRLSFDLLERFGEDLLQAVELLERKGIAHRDIKPDNIGVDFSGSVNQLHLVLFDFSLSRCPIENIRAGTPGYLDPFLSLRKPPRWDLQAERYAAAVTLYQMATGVLPIWHDGKTDPTMVDCEVTIDVERFDANLREKFADFFGKALRRNPRERFDNAHQMLEEWKDLFSTKTPSTSVTTDGLETDNSAFLVAATLDTNVAELGLGLAAVDALDRLNVVKVRDLFHVGRRLTRMRGVGNKTRKRILATVKMLRERLGVTTSVEPPAPTTEGTDAYDGPTASDKLSIDSLYQRILRAKAKDRGATETIALESLLGFDQRVSVAWPSQADVASIVGVTRGRISQILADALPRWVRDPAITVLREQIAVLLGQNAGVMSAFELCDSLITLRGSVEDEPRRTRQGQAVTRAAVETENVREEPRYFVRRVGSNALITTDLALADYAVALGEAADTMAMQDPLVPPARVIEVLRAIPVPLEVEPLSDARLVRLAAAASQIAALSSKQEIYPRNLDIGRAIKLSHGGLVGVASLTPEQIRQRITSRYPLVAPFPPRSELDKLLTDAGLQLAWDPDRANGGAYVSTARNPLSVTNSSGTPERYSTLVRSTLTTPTPQFNPAFVSPDVAEARQFEDRLLYAQKHGSFLALTVPIKFYDQARAELAARFAGRVVDLEAVFLDSLQLCAHEVGADWEVVVSADASAPDAAAPNTADWRNLNQLIASKVIPKVEAALLADDTAQTVLAYNLDWLARYGQVVMLPRIQQAVLSGKIHGVWMLIPSSSQTPMPLLDGTAVPVTSSNQWAAIPESWCQNVHRSTASRREATR